MLAGRRGRQGCAAGRSDRRAGAPDARAKVTDGRKRAPARASASAAVAGLRAGVERFLTRSFMRSTRCRGGGSGWGGRGRWGVSVGTRAAGGRTRAEGRALVGRAGARFGRFQRARRTSARRSRRCLRARRGVALAGGTPDTAFSLFHRPADAGWLPRPVPWGLGGTIGAAGAVRRVTRACALSARVRGFVSLFRRRAAAIRRRARVRSARWRAAPAASSVSGTKRLRNGFSESGFARFVTPKSNRRLGTRRSAPEAWARRAAVIRREREMHSDWTTCQSSAYAAARRSLAPHPSPRDGRGTESRGRLGVLASSAGGRPPRGFGDRVGRVRCGGLDRPGERHSSPRIPPRPSPRRVRSSRTGPSGVTARTTSSPPLEDLHSGACAGLSALTSIGRSAKGEDIRVLEISAEPVASSPSPPSSSSATCTATSPRARVHPPIRAARVPRRVPRATDRTLVAGRRALPRRRRVRRRRRRRTRRRRRRARPRRACSSSPPSIPTGSPRSDARTPTVAI